MSVLQIYSIRDDKMGVFHSPNLYKHVEEVTRSIKTFLASDKQNNLSEFSEDFSLYLVGYFDTESGIISLPVTGLPQFTIGIASLKKGGST